MKVAIETEDKYTPGKVKAEFSIAEWEALRGFAAAHADELVAATHPRAAATRLAAGSKPYWGLALNWSRLFHEDK